MPIASLGSTVNKEKIEELEARIKKLERRMDKVDPPPKKPSLFQELQSDPNIEQLIAEND